MHEPYAGSSERTFRRLVDELEVAEVYAERHAQDERDAVIAADPRSHEQAISDEWAPNAR